MKYTTLKKISGSSLIFASMLTFFATNNAKAVNTKRNEVKKAHEIVKRFKSNLDSFFGDKKKEKYKQHLNKFAKIVTDIEKLMATIEAKNKANPSVKNEKMLEFLAIIKKDAQNIFNALNATGVKQLVVSLITMFKKYKSEGHIEKLMNKFDELKQHLDKKERAEVDNMITTLQSFKTGVPTSKIRCLAILSRIFRRK